jgi:hypothetical protein
MAIAEIRRPRDHQYLVAVTAYHHQIPTTLNLDQVTITSYLRHLDASFCYYEWHTSGCVLFEEKSYVFTPLKHLEDDGEPVLNAATDPISQADQRQVDSLPQ